MEVLKNSKVCLHCSKCFTKNVDSFNPHTHFIIPIFLMRELKAREVKALAGRSRWDVTEPGMAALAVWPESGL